MKPSLIVLSSLGLLLIMLVGTSMSMNVPLLEDEAASRGEAPLPAITEHKTAPSSGSTDSIDSTLSLSSQRSDVEPMTPAGNISPLSLPDEEKAGLTTDEDETPPSSPRPAGDELLPTQVTSTSISAEPKPVMSSSISHVQSFQSLAEGSTPPRSSPVQDRRFNSAQPKGRNPNPAEQGKGAGAGVPWPSLDPSDAHFRWHSQGGKLESNIGSERWT